MQICRKINYIDWGGVDHSNNKKRVGWIDIAKGIAILLVVCGHSLTNSNKEEMIFLGIIFSFHMPLFIILSAITCKYSTNLKNFWKNTLKAAKHLLIPAFIIFLFWMARDLYHWPKGIVSVQFWKDRLNAILYYRLRDGIGFTWFFIALFTTRVIFDFFQMTISKKMLLSCVIIASAVGIALGKNEFYPYTWSFDIALAMSPFMYIGYCWKDISGIKISNIKKIFVVIFCFIFWLILAIFMYKEFLDIAQRRYPNFPLDFLVAIAGSVVLIALSKGMEKLKIFFPLQFLGRYCIYFYCVHCVDTEWSEWYRISNNYIIVFLTRVAIDLAFFLLLVGLHISISQIIKHRKFKKEGKV